MNTTCPACHMRYDDAERSTICPHEMLMTRRDLLRKDAAIALMGENIRFKHMPDSEITRVTTITWNGMVYVDGLSGIFDPSLFEVIQDE